ncbi:MAG: hypothetical protein AAFU73_08715 [Planctomycetota bacterium]
MYAATDIELVLSLNPIDTAQRRVPEHLAGVALDDARVVASFCTFADHVLSKLPDVDLRCIAVGNEVDVALGADADA